MRFSLHVCLIPMLARRAVQVVMIVQACVTIECAFGGTEWQQGVRPAIVPIPTYRYEYSLTGLAMFNDEAMAICGVIRSLDVNDDDTSKHRYLLGTYDQTTKCIRGSKSVLRTYSFDQMLRNWPLTVVNDSVAVCSGTPAVMVTSDRGVTWRPLIEHDTKVINLRAASAVAGKYVVLGSMYSKYIAVSEDAATTYTKYLAPDTSGERTNDLYMIDSMCVIGFSQYNRAKNTSQHIYRSRDRCRSWQQIEWVIDGLHYDVLDSVCVKAIVVDTNRHIWALASSQARQAAARVLLSTNDGDSWRTVSLEEDTSQASVQYATILLGTKSKGIYVIRENGVVLRWDSQTDLWSYVISQPAKGTTNKDVYSVLSSHIEDDATMYIVGYSDNAANIFSSHDVSAGIESDSNMSGFQLVHFEKVYPNPTSGRINVLMYLHNSVTQSDFKVGLYSMSGELELDLTKQIDLSVRGWSIRTFELTGQYSGSYYLTCHVNGIVRAKKIIIMR